MTKVAFILDEMFEDSEFKVPYDRVREAGHEAIVVGLEKGKTVQGKKGKDSITIEMSADEADLEAFTKALLSQIVQSST